jgi:lipoprotein NlpD
MGRLMKDFFPLRTVSTIPKSQTTALLLLLLLIVSCSGFPVKGDRPRGVYHVVKSGETLSIIAKAYRVTPQELAEVNNISQPGPIEVDSVIFVPDATQVQDDIVTASRSHEGPQAVGAADEPPPKAKTAAPATVPHVGSPKKGVQAETAKKRDKEPANTAAKDRTTPSRAADQDAASRKPSARSEGENGDAAGPTREAEAKPDELFYDKDRFTWPVKGKVVSRFGIQPNRMYFNGIRITGGEGTAVQAAAGGVVIFSASLKDYGETIIIKHSDQYATVYAHLGTRTVRGEARVKKGDRIAFLGRAADKEDPYLHFEIRYRNKARNPLFFLP